MNKPITVDFETEAIARRPVYPPKPVGVSIKHAGRAARYYAWGHPVENNCTQDEARRVLKDVWASGDLLFQAAKFDIDVAETHLGLCAPAWHRIHDTLYLLFLHDPHALNLSLKPSAERILGIAPEERDELKEWICANVPEAKRKPSSWGAYICRAPGKLAGRYANGDVVRTELLFKRLYPEICERGMQDAYDRERRLMPILLQNEREGVQLDLRRLERDIKVYQQALVDADQWLRTRLRTKDLNIDADRDFAAALEKCKVVTEWVYTKTGQRSVSKDNLTPDMFRDLRVASVYGYRNRMQTCLSMFLEPWLEVAQQTGGVIFTTWNQVRQNHGAESLVGARTGRLSSTPNFQNIVKDWKKAASAGYQHPAFLKALPPLPLPRQYFLPDKGGTWGRRDFNQQELRILAHFEDGQLLADYRANPRLDIHTKVHDGIFEIVNLDLPRDAVKILNFADIYGRGLAELAAAMAVTVAEAQRVRNAKNQLMPGVLELGNEIKLLGKQGQPIRTWGGREYYAEKPKYVAKFNRVMDFCYKLLNYLIQGSAADCTKESIIRYHEHPKREGRFLLTVHDENDISAPKNVIKQEMILLRDCMASVEFDLPMLSDGEIGKSWGTLKALKESN